VPTAMETFYSYPVSVASENFRSLPDFSHGLLVSCHRNM